MKSVMQNHTDETGPFRERLKPNSRVLVWGGGQGTEDATKLTSAGHEITSIDANLFYQAPAENFEGVWVNLALSYYASDVAQRMIAIFFKGLKPGGCLGWVAYEGQGIVGSPRDITKPVYLMTEKQHCSLVEQTGFKIEKVGHQPGDPLSKILILATRI
jgi:predicted methyltransferase